jgi:polyphosphate glucokinase
MNQILGVDIGGSGIKGQPVNIETGELIGERYRIATPHPATPAAIAEALGRLVRHFNWNGPIGCGFPAVVQHGIVKTASNIDSSWIGTNAEELFRQAAGVPVFVANDADVAGLAEKKLGAGMDCRGVSLLITIGTGLGTALFIDDHLVPNTELGHLRLNGKIAEHYASDAVRKREDLSWKKWGKRFYKYLQYLEFLFSPDLFILGGGASKKMDKFAEFLEVNAQVVPAKLLNHAGIVGAALYAGQRL